MYYELKKLFELFGYNLPRKKESGGKVRANVCKEK